MKIKIIPFVLALLLLSGCSGISEELPEENVTEETVTEETFSEETVPETEITSETTAPVTEKTEETEPEINVKTVSFTALGDNLIHSAIYNQAARRSENGGYDFYPAYEGAADLLDKADITILNQETLICGDDKYEPSTYPDFNSPEALGDCMRDLGVDVFTIANNHTLDKGAKGLEACLDYYDGRGMMRVGAYRDREDRENIRTMEVDGVTVSFLCYTEALNDNSLPESSPLSIGMFHRDTIKKEIAKAKEISDICVVSLHWGAENFTETEDWQRDAAKEFAEAGADVIIGNHPHVLQEIEIIERSDGSETICAYSLGNFISAQDRGTNLIGGVLDFNVNIDMDDGRIFISDKHFIPVITHFDGNFRDIRLIKLSDYPEEMADSHGVRSMSPFGYEFIIDYLKEKGLYEE